MAGLLYLITALLAVTGSFSVIRMGGQRGNKVMFYSGGLFMGVGITLIIMGAIRLIEWTVFSS